MGSRTKKVNKKRRQLQIVMVALKETGRDGWEGSRRKGPVVGKEMYGRSEREQD